MDIKRQLVLEQIELEIIRHYEPKSLAKVLPIYYDMAMEVVVEVLNSDYKKEIPELLFDEINSRNENTFIWNTLGEYLTTLCSNIRMHFIREGHDKKIKYKFVPSAVEGMLAVDKIVPDANLTICWNKDFYSQDNERKNIDELNDLNPDLDTVNYLYDYQEKELKSNRKYKNRF